MKYPIDMMRTLLLFSFLLISLAAFASSELPNERFWDPPKVSVYPNPTSDFFGISNSTEVAQVAIFNLVGKEMRSFKAEEGIKYNVSDLPNGMYLIQMTNHKKKIINTQRLHKR